MSNRGYRNRGPTSHYGGARNAVNPWEGGMVPGRGGGGSGGGSNVSGLLPTPPQQGAFLSTETQLALASNLLNTLLRPHQQQQVPSLLSLNTVGQMGGGGQGYGYGQGRFQDRRKALGGRDGRRVEPYGKPGQGRRGPIGSRDRKIGQGRNSNLGKGRSSTPKGGSKKEEDKDDDKSKGDDVKSEKKDVDGEADEKENEDDENKGKDEDRNAGRYSGVPSNLFFCHVCNKHMWDGQSFDNHLKGRTHQLMMDKLEESYRIKVELLRHELKVAEQQREIEMDRMKRQGKKFHVGAREYCTMCDLTFYGSLVAHRKFDRHQHLKAFLHPRCAPCGKEFPTRIEWDHHKLTPIHLKKFAESRKERQINSDDEFTLDDFIGNDAFGSFGKREIKVRTREDEEDDIQEAKDKKDDDDKNESKDESKENAEEPSLDESLPTTFSELKSRIPKYNPDNAVGKSMLKVVTGLQCKVCHRFFENDDDATIHCRTLTHYNNFVSLLKSKARAFEAKERREAMKKKEGENAEPGKRSADEEASDGSWKRRKVSNEESEEDEKYDESNEDGHQTGDEKAEADANHDEEAKSPEKEVKSEDASDKEADAPEVDGESEGDGVDEESGKEVSPKGQKAAARPRGSSGAATPAATKAATTAAQNRGRGRRRK